MRSLTWCGVALSGALAFGSIVQADHKSYIVCPSVKVLYDMARTVAESGGEVKDSVRIRHTYCWNITPPHVLPEAHPLDRPPWAVPYGLGAEVKWWILRVENGNPVLR